MNIPEPTAEDADPFVSRLERELPALPFLALPFAETLSGQLGMEEEFLRSFRHMLVLGIGGSALGTRALQKAFAPGQDWPGHEGPWLWIADNVDPPFFEGLLSRLPPGETLAVVVSKSGGTVETLAQYFLVLSWLQKNLPATWQEHLFIVTDERCGFLREEANRHGARSLPVPDHLGGRYSVLSAVGLVPAVFLGVDWRALLRGAIDVGRPLAADPAGLPLHASWRLAVWGTELMKAGLNQLIFFCYVPSWATFGAWFAQLWAESLGKSGRGSMPLPALGVTDQHSLLQMFLDGPRDKGCFFLSGPCPPGPVLPAALPSPWEWLGGKPMGDILEAETLATRMSLVQRGVPLVHLQLAETGEYAAGQMMMMLEAATVFSGWRLGIDPLDQPAVEEGKILAKARMGAPGNEKAEERLRAFLSSAAAVQGQTL
jgi:glucose-6-phosphate isomerase